MLAGLEDEIQTLKSEIVETTKIERARINKLQEFIDSPDKHFESIKETADKLALVGNQLQLADAERKKLLIANNEACNKQIQTELQL